MRIFEKIENKVVRHYIKSYNLMDRYIKLPWYVKMIISPIALLIFFTLIFPVIIFLGSLYKVLLFLYKAFKKVFRNWRLVINSFFFFAISIAIIFITIIFFTLFLSIYVVLVPMVPILILKIICFCIAPYLLLLFFFNGNSTLKKLKTTIKSISESDNDLDEYKKLIKEASDGKYSQNPLLWIIKSPFTLLTTSSIVLISALFVVLFVSVTINSSFPDIFFSTHESAINQLHFWFVYLLDQLLILIPIDIISPFLPDNSETLVKQPWGGLLSILFQMFLAYIAYLYISTIILSAKYFTKMKTTNNLP